MGMMWQQLQTPGSAYVIKHRESRDFIACTIFGESGDWDVGDRDVGDWDVDDWDVGDWDVGDWDVGDWKLGDRTTDLMFGVLPPKRVLIVSGSLLRESFEFTTWT